MKIPAGDAMANLVQIHEDTLCGASVPSTAANDQSKLGDRCEMPGRLQQSLTYYPNRPTVKRGGGSIRPMNQSGSGAAEALFHLGN
jgi:hypothetical protein